MGMVGSSQSSAAPFDVFRQNRQRKQPDGGAGMCDFVLQYVTAVPTLFQRVTTPAGDSLQQTCDKVATGYDSASRKKTAPRRI
jgi:hypothetical protein